MCAFKFNARDYVARKIADYKPTKKDTGPIGTAIKKRIGTMPDESVSKFHNAKMGKPIRKDMIKSHRNTGPVSDAVGSYLRGKVNSKKKQWRL